MRKVGQLFPVLMVVLGLIYAYVSFRPGLVVGGNGGMYAIAAAILLGTVVVAAGFEKSSGTKS